MYLTIIKWKSCIHFEELFFNKNTQLGKEYELYKVLTTENYKSETKSSTFNNAVIKTHQKINSTSLKREKYNFSKRN